MEWEGALQIWKPCASVWPAPKTSSRVECMLHKHALPERLDTAQYSQTCIPGGAHNNFEPYLNQTHWYIQQIKMYKYITHVKLQFMLHMN
jgi:hypothetical protein